MSNASTVSVAGELLFRQQTRRARGTPTVSVLVSKGGAAYETWTSYGFPPPRGNTTWSTQHPFSLARAFTEELVRTAGIHEPCLHYLSSFSKRPPEEIAVTIAAATRLSMSTYLASLGVDARLTPALLFCLAHATKDLSLTDQAKALHAILGGDPARTCDRIAEISVIWGVANLPAIWIATDHAGPSALDELEKRIGPLASSIAGRVPQLPIAVSVEPPLWENFLSRAPDSRAKAILREGEIVVEPLATPIAPPAVGSGNALDDGARSEAERFLFAQFQCSAKTAGLFELNGKLQGLSGRVLEVDFLCRSYQIAVEVDGYYHFEDVDAYRRDRAKDLELQKLDYLVIRVLAEDVVARLEFVLATVNEALSMRRQHSNQPTKESNGTTFC